MSIELYAGEDQLVPEGFGLGFFGDGGFGFPVSIGEFQGRTFVTNASGTSENFEVNNNKKISNTEVVYGQEGSGITLTALPNILATANFRFEHPTSDSVQTQNARLYIYDGSSTGGTPNKTTEQPGIEFWAAEIRHQDEIQVDNGLGDSAWQEINGSVFLELIDSPGTSGIRPDGIFTTDSRHDWYIAMSVSPSEFGDKQFGMVFELEFL